MNWGGYRPARARVAGIPRIVFLTRLADSSVGFTFAHELCHLLYDRSYGWQLAIASGQWAPRDVEPRANAFAAMLLMPTDVVMRVVRSLTVPLEILEAIREDNSHRNHRAPE